MSTLWLMTLVFVGYIIAYRTYGRFVGNKIFELSTKAVVPSVELEDGIDFVPTNKHVIFGHHYTSIAGTGPIVGPAIAVIWGWVPALIWIFFGSIFMGAVHDFGALVISLRNQGQSLSEFAAKYINNRIRFLLFLIIFLELLVVIAIFGMVIGVIFHIFPSSVFPVWFQIPIAISLGILVYKKGWKLGWPSVAALVLMYLTVIIGYYYKFTMPSVWGVPPTGVWTVILLIYAFIASVLPVTVLLQPRDYINSHQLVFAMAILVLGIIVTSFKTDLSMVAPAVQLHPADAPPMWPSIFIIIACGAISGFHSLVSSGTSSKQVKCEHDAMFVGFGSMLMEGALAFLVLIAVGAGIGLGYKGMVGFDAWNAHYSSWVAAEGLGSKISAFVVGAANIIENLGIPRFVAVAVMGVFVASFASTTLDSATRIQRYVVTEIFNDLNIKVFNNRYLATFFVIFTAATLAFASGAGGKGALALWPLFGAVNQTLAALALIVITIYLKGKGGFKWMVSGIPAVIMTVITLYATIFNQINFLREGKFLLSVINLLVILIVLWIIVECFLKFKELKPKTITETA